MTLTKKSCTYFSTQNQKEKGKNPMSSRELEIINKNLVGDYTVSKADFLTVDLVKNSQRFLKTVSDNGKKSKEHHCVLIAITKK